MITSKTKICMVIGDPIDHSNSPQIHNAGYKALGCDYVYIACNVKSDNLKNFISGVRAMGIVGVSLTSPHKEIVLPFLDEIDDTAKKIGAVNTIVNKNGILHGYNTDWLGAVEPIKTRTKLKGAKVAVLGAGGAGRALVYGLTQAGCEVTIYNRHLDKAKTLAQMFGCKSLELNYNCDISKMDIICNATTVGLNAPGESPINTSNIGNGQIVFDAVYSPIQTKLLRDAENNGATIIHGTEMLLELGSAQFELFTGLSAPKEHMKKAIDGIINAR